MNAWGLQGSYWTLPTYFRSTSLQAVRWSVWQRLA